MSTHSPTKRELREQRRAERLAAEQAASKQAARRRGAWLLAAAAGVAAVAVAAAVALSHNSSKPPATAGQISSAAAMFAGIPEHDGVLGDPKAPLTVTEYVDLQCPICREASQSTLPTLVRDYVRTGKVKLQARTLHFIGPDSTKAARVAAGAQQQGKLWPFLETFYANQGQENSGYVTDSFLRQVAKAAGVDASAALGQADSAFATARLNQANSDASKLGIDSTPTLTVAKGDGAEHLLDANALDASSVSAALDKALGR
jgi:protein-disulfide isomerase